MLGTKDKKDHPESFQTQVQKSGSVMLWGCVRALGKAHLHFFMMAALMQRAWYDFRATYAAPKTTSFPGTSMHFLTRSFKTTH